MKFTKPGIRKNGNTKPIIKPVILLVQKLFLAISKTSNNESAASRTTGIIKNHIDGNFSLFNFLKTG